LTFGMIYYIAPKLFGTKLYSEKLATAHFWIGLTGIVVYYLSMWAAGITQGLMWRAIGEDGRLVYPDFVETVTRIVPLYHVRALGGLLFIVGALIMVYNISKTIRGRAIVDDKIPEPFEKRNVAHKPDVGHRKLEGMGLAFSILAFMAIAVGSVIEIIPTLSMHRYLATDKMALPYTPLELAGRDIYIKEGCYVCHSQMIRKLPFDALRFGPPSTIEDSMYDRPFQWGSKRTGPDLARVGKKYPDLWHYRHMKNPREVINNSIMPNYPWLLTQNTDFYSLRRKLSVMKTLGVPYDDETVANADIVAEKQAEVIAQGLREQGVVDDRLEQREIVAMIAYLQALGHKVVDKEESSEEESSDADEEESSDADTGLDNDTSVDPDSNPETRIDTDITAGPPTAEITGRDSEEIP